MLFLHAAVEDFDVIKLRRILDGDLGMAGNLCTDAVHGGGIPLLYHHQRFSVEIFYGETFFFCQRMLPGHGDAVLIGSQRQEVTVLLPDEGVADANEKIEFLSQGRNLRHDAGVIVLERNDVETVAGESVVDPVPKIHKRLAGI